MRTGVPADLRCWVVELRGFEPLTPSLRTLSIAIRRCQPMSCMVDPGGAGVDGCGSWLLDHKDVADFLPTITAFVR